MKDETLRAGTNVLLVLAMIVPWAGCGEEDGPNVPHAVTSLDDNSCRSCHGNASSGAPQSPHPGKTNCVGCHAAPTPVPVDGGADASGPPKIPHAVSATDDPSCLACHKDGLNGAKKTPHPDRTGCTGCHKGS